MSDSALEAVWWRMGATGYMETGPDTGRHSPLILSLQKGDRGGKREAPSQPKQKVSPYAAQNSLVRELLPAKWAFTSLRR